ncbi:MAG: flagellar biosynthesis protein FliQ [Alphaproteobacteria bacterium]|nr:flagellar biosynthesis protein FliQ [Alphaproteobacteria bacterium]MBF0129542.1 flagellar biosynthesis protein FliQ [Alphaproteobacteria bacterium]
MNEAEVLEVTREAILILVKISAPTLMVGMVIGLVISLFQALTSIQEMTLTFVPKILVVFLSLIVFAPFMLHELTAFTQMMFDRIVGLG